MAIQYRQSAQNVWRIGALGLTIAFAQPALAIDWSSVPGKEVVLFYPGQASFEWTLTPSDHSGAGKFREGKNCKECHGGEEADIGATIASGKKLDPSPVAGRPGSIKATVKTAHDGDSLFVHIEWPEPPALAGSKMDPDHEIKATFMFDGGKVAAAKRAGCWASCHDDVIGMASAGAGKDLTKYLARSRTKVTRQGGGENFKPDAEMDSMLADGEYLEFWQVQANKGAPGVPADGYVLDRRHTNDKPIANASADFADGKWTVVLSRKLTPGSARHQDVVPGQTYTVGFAIHESYSAHRFHFVSFEHTLVVDQGNGDFVAMKK